MIIGYFELRAWVPLLAYMGYMVIRGRFSKRTELCLLRLSIVGYLTVAMLLIIGLVIGFPLKGLTGVRLSYESAIEGVVFGAIIVAALWVRTRDAVLSVVLSVLCLSAVGWMYEISFWNPINMFINPISLASPLAVNTQIISLTLFIWTLGEHGWKPRKATAAAFLLYIVTGIYLAVNYPHGLLKWCIRIPSYMLLLALVYDVRDDAVRGNDAVSRKGDAGADVCSSSDPHAIL